MGMGTGMALGASERGARSAPVVWPVLEAQGRAVREEVAELGRVATAELFRVRGLLALQNPLVLLFFGVGLEPWNEPKRTEAWQALGVRARLDGRASHVSEWCVVPTHLAKGGSRGGST